MIKKVLFQLILLFVVSGSLTELAYAKKNQKHHEETHQDLKKQKKTSHQEDKNAGHRGHSSGHAIGAVKKVRHGGKEFQLSKESLEYMGVQTKEFKAFGHGSGYKYIIPRQALLSVKDHHGVFVKRHQWFRFFKVKVLKKKQSKVIVQSEEFDKSENIATHRAAFLRLTELQLSGGAGKGHGH